jgi:hypothetical protein
MGAYAHFTAVDRGNHKAHQLKKFFPQYGVGHDAHFDIGGLVAIKIVSF